MRARGFVIAGGLPVDEIETLAARAEERGYTSIWLTVGANEPGTIVRAALDATTRIEVGIGVVPLDRYPAASILDQLESLPYERLVLGVGVGRTTSGAAALVEREVRAIKHAQPKLCVGVGTYSAAVLEVAGREADMLVLNWMTPERLSWATMHATAGAARAGRSRPFAYLYISSAVGPDAAAKIDAALAAFRQYPYHRRHQDALGEHGTVGAAVTSAAQVDAALDRYGGAIPVVNPIGTLTVPERLHVLEVFAPGGGEGLNHERR